VVSRSISLKFAAEFDDIRAETLEMFKVEWSKVKVTAHCKVSTVQTQ